MRIEVDVTGEGVWIDHTTIRVMPRQTAVEEIPASLQARWIRFTATRDTTATAWLIYD